VRVVQSTAGAALRNGFFWKELEEKRVGSGGHVARGQRSSVGDQSVQSCAERWEPIQRLELASLSKPQLSLNLMRLAYSRLEVGPSYLAGLLKRYAARAARPKTGFLVSMGCKAFHRSVYRQAATALHQYCLPDPVV